MTEQFIQPCDYKKFFDISVGKTSYGNIYGVQLTKDDTKTYAHKMLTSEIPTSHPNLNEIDIMFRLNSPFIVKGQDITGYGECSTNSSGIVMELATGNLLNLSNLPDFTYEDREKALFQIASGVNCLHENGYLHLDIKPENVLCFQESGVTTFKLTDFGLSSCSSSLKIFAASLRISSWYRPPVSRMDRYVYSDKSDIFSLGILFLGLFHIGRSNLPYKTVTDDKVYAEQIEFFGPKNLKNTLQKWINVSMTDSKKLLLIHLLENMLNFDKYYRYDIQQVLDHEFFKEFKIVPTDVLKDLPLVCPHFNGKMHEGLLNMIKLTISYFFNDKSIEFLFTSIDLYMRLVTCCGPYLTEEECKLMGYTALLISYKIYYWDRTLPDYYLDNKEAIDKIEINFLKNVVVGKILQDLVYKKARCLEDLVQFYKDIILNLDNCKLYLCLDLDKIYESYPRGINKKLTYISIFHKHC